MIWLIGLAIVAGLLANRLGGSASSASASTGNRSGDGASSTRVREDDDDDWQRRSSLFDDDDLSGVTCFAGSSILSDSTSSDSLSCSSINDCALSINPANGLPMVGCVDIEGNPYGTDSSHWHDHLISSCSLLDDSFFSSGCSLFDDSISSSSSSMFDDSFSSSSSAFSD